MSVPPGIAYQRAGDVRDVRTFERVLVSLFCADTDPGVRVAELVDSLSADLAGVAEVPVTATETVGLVVEDPEVSEPAALPRVFHFTRGCAGV